ncbi:PREDICTED: sugar transporter ERD6-like 18 isoform X4 [Wasmannia auropunctata]|uniref:sugar transporter ERD6-like 18 isoform X4 n=1 Tax=Wasmannia auropunctata TaxID=64793 RepID=UPI0005EEABAD|nr:PREDICTED: sugar transporter ERD6-like 18 isoform X4 [Wasmannia auropunctata]
MCQRLNVRKEVLRLFLYALVCNLALINGGASVGYSSIVLPILTSNLSSITLNAMEMPFFVSIIPLTSAIGCILCLIMLNYGRRFTMIVCSVNFSLGWILIASSYNVLQLFIGRALTGIALGLCSPVNEIYLAEISISSWREVLTLTPGTAASIGVLIVYFLGFVAKKFSGIYVIAAYSVDMITRISITIDPFLITVIIGSIYFVTMVITASCSKKIGRRLISIISGVGISISLGGLAVYLQFFEDTGVVVIPFICILLYVAFGAFGFFSIPWSMIPELYPTKYINVLGILTTILALSYDYVAIQLYPLMVTTNRNATIYFYCITAIIATVFLTVALPETRGKTKAQVEEAFRGKSQIRNL